MDSLWDIVGAIVMCVPSRLVNIEAYVQMIKSFADFVMLRNIVVVFGMKAIVGLVYHFCLSMGFHIVNVRKRTSQTK